MAVDFGKELTPQTDVMLYHLVIVSECCEAAFSQYDLANAHGALTMVPVYGWAKSVVRFLRPGSSNSESEVSLTAFFFSGTVVCFRGSLYNSGPGGRPEIA